VVFANFTSNVDGGGFIITPTSDQFLDANAILDDQGADDMDRRIVNSPKTDARTTTALQGLLNPTPEISEQFRSGKMKSGLGYARWFRDQTVISHTSGAYKRWLLRSVVVVRQLVQVAVTSPLMLCHWSNS
jgi:hypothetical protein